MSFTITIAGCLPCCGGPAIECRTRGGTAILCGYSEYAGHASTPPKKYRTKTLSGSYQFDEYFGGYSPPCDPANLNCSRVKTFSGSCEYNANTCAVTSAGVEATTGCATGNANVCTISPFPDNFTYNTTATTKTITGDSSGCIDLGFMATQMVGTPDATETLSSEDTEADAAARLLATVNYSGWGAGCTSQYESRANFQFAYVEAQFRYNATGLANSTNYTLSVEAWRSLHAAANYALYAYVNTVFTTDGTGAATITGDVPIQVGYDTYVANPVVV